MTSSPSYITKNRLGIYCFQYVIPSIIYKSDEKQPRKLFRKSLHTRERREALKQARFLWLIMDKLINKYFKDPNALGRAIELLKKFDSFSDSNWETVQSEFFDALDDGTDEPALLDLALKMREESLVNEANNVEEINRYKKIIDALMTRQSPTAQIPQTRIENPKLSILILKWLKIKKAANLRKSSLTSITQRIYMFAKIIDEISECDPIISELSETSIRDYYNLLLKIPSRRNAKELKGKSFTELSTLGLPPLSAQSYLEYLNVVTEFLQWVEGDGYPVNKQLAKILLNRKSKNNHKVNNTIKALPFNESDIDLIFMNESYKIGNYKRASDYWVPLIALFTGARLGEICQLHLEDIKFIDNEWVIDITEDSKNDVNEKSIKSDKGSKRVIPIHLELINLGLIEYRVFLLHKSENLLFPNERRNSQNKFDAISKRFNNKLKLIGVKEELGIRERKSFHSFRHTVRTKLSELSIEEGLIDSIIGHSSYNRSVGERVYTHSNRVKQKRTVLNKLKYNFNIKLIKNWTECKFGRELKRDDFKFKL